MLDQLKISANSSICTEADEAYVIGKRGQYTPVGAYLAGDEIIKIALQHGVQMIHPGNNESFEHTKKYLIPF